MVTWIFNKQRVSKRYFPNIRNQMQSSSRSSTIYFQHIKRLLKKLHHPKHLINPHFLHKNKRTYLVAMIKWLENKKHCLKASFSDLKCNRLLELFGLSLGKWMRLPKNDSSYYKQTSKDFNHEPCRTKTWFTSRSMSHPSTIILSTAKFFRRFSVSET